MAVSIALIDDHLVFRDAFRALLSSMQEFSVVAEGKETREFDGRMYVMERGIVGDFSLVAAHKGDRLGNLVYRKTARSFNPMAATAGKICIAEVEELVEPGDIDPDHVHTPGIFVHRVVVAKRQKRIEQRTVRKG